MFENALRFEKLDPLPFGGRTFPIDNGLFLVWKPQCHPSRLRARCFNVDIAYIAPFAGSRMWQKVLRYLFSLPLTFYVLFKRRPKTVFVLNQPTPLVIVAYVYCLLTGGRYVLDAHSGPYLPTYPAILRWLYRHFTRRALFSVNHNRIEANLVCSYGGASVFLPMVPVDMNAPSGVKIDIHQPSVLAVCSMAANEPLDVIFDTARALPNVTIYMTGDPTKLDVEVLADKPANIHLTGFLPYDDYLVYLTETSLVLTLSRHRHIMQTAVDECLCYGAALVANDAPVIIEMCGDAARYTDLDPQNVASQIQLVLEDIEGHRERMRNRLAVQEAWLASTLEDTARRFFPDVKAIDDANEESSRQS